jgi:hypothetical protein
MDLENANSNSDNVVVSNLNNANFSFSENCKTKFKNGHYYVLLKKDVTNAPKNKFLILFTSLINIA